MRTAAAFFAFMAAISPTFSIQVQPDEKAAMDKIKFMLGSFTGESIFTMGPDKVKVPTTAAGAVVMAGRFCELNIKYEIPGMLTEGKSMISYDAATKTYTGWWFDGTNSGTIKQSGQFVGDSLVFLTKTEDAVHGVLVRTTWKPTAKGAKCTVEMKPGDAWTTMVDVELLKADKPQ